MVGYGYSTITIENSYNSGDVSSFGYNYSYSGALVGYGSRYSVIITIKNVYSLGNIKAISEKGSDYTYRGGIVGYCYCDLLGYCYCNLQINGQNYYVDADRICGNADAEIIWGIGASCIKTDVNIPDDVGDSIRFQRKVYEFSKDSLIDTDGGYNGELSVLLKDESMANKITYTMTNEDITELSSTKNSQIYIHLIGEENYNCEKTINVALLKNGETIVTASLPNGDRSSCIVRVKGFPMTYEYKSDPETPHISVNTSFDNQLNYQNGSFDKSTIPVKILVTNIAIIKESGDGYTEGELSKCNLKDVKMQIELPEGLSLNPDNSSDKFKTFDMNDIDVGGNDSIEFNIYPTSLAAKTLKFYAKLTSNNYKESNTYIINVNSDEKVNYDVANPFFTGFLDEDGKQTTLSPEERFKLNVGKYNTAIEDYENFTANRINGMKTASEKNENSIYAHIKETLKENMVFNYTSESGNFKESAEQEAAALKGLYKYISEQTDSAIGIGKIDLSKTDKLGMISIETSVAKTVLNSIKNGKNKYTYSIDKYDVIIYDAGSNWGPVIGSIQLVDRTTGKEVSGKGAFSTSADKCKKVMQAYAGEIAQMGINAINSSISQTIDFLSDKSGVKKYITGKFGDFLEEKLPKFRGALNDKGLGEVATFISNTYKMQKALNGIDVNNLEGSKKLLEQLLNQEKNLEEAPTIKTMAAKKAYDMVKKARNAVISSGMAYLTNSPEPDNIITKAKNVLKSWNFMCLVDIIIHDESGNQIGSIIGDHINCNSEII